MKNSSKKHTPSEFVLPWLEAHFAARGLRARFDYAGIKVTGRHVHVPVHVSRRNLFRGIEAMVDAEEAWNELRPKHDDLRLRVVPATSKHSRGRSNPSPFAELLASQSHTK